jgi:transposase InsO family protein/transposase-like protein
VERKRGQRYGEKFRRRAVEQMNACDNIVRLAQKLGVTRRLLYKWRDDLEALYLQAENGQPIINSRESTLRKELLRVKRLLAEKTVELDFFKSALQRVEARRQKSDIAGERASTRRSEMPLQGSLSVERMCQLAQVSRAGYYRHLQSRAPRDEDMSLRSAIQQIVLENRGLYGYRRVTLELRSQGMIANHKRVIRLMREDNLLAIRCRKQLPVKECKDEQEVYPNLARRLKVSGPNQLWIADMTYVRLRKEFVYLAVILDAYSRRVVGWSLDRTLRARLPLNALKQAIINRQPPPGLVHHSDRGAQYASAEYVRVLQDHEMISSMSRPGNPYDNATCESFFKTLKREEVYANDYEDLEHVLESVGEFVDRYYNCNRLHSALGYRSPAKFENQPASGTVQANTVGLHWDFAGHGTPLGDAVP